VFTHQRGYLGQRCRISRVGCVNDQINNVATYYLDANLVWVNSSSASAQKACRATGFAAYYRLSTSTKVIRLAQAIGNCAGAYGKSEHI